MEHKSKAVGLKKKTMISIQYARAFAALIVVYTHIFSNHIAAPWGALSEYGFWGVDIFFVISGFIMSCSIQDSHPTSRQFLQNRIMRIYPLYWIAVTIWIVGRLVIPDRLNNADVSLQTVIYSYLLIPHWHLVFSDHAWPILIPGWTLQIEMFFYIVLSLTLWIRRDKAARMITIGILILLVGVGMVVMTGNAILYTYTNPLLLEFIAGMVLAECRTAIAQIKAQSATVIFFSSVMLAVPALYLPDSMRVIFRGIPAFLFVGSITALEPSLLKRPIKSLLLIGDASYSIYLLHPIAISLAAVVWVKAKFPVGAVTGSISFVPLAMSAAVLIGIFSFVIIERRIINLLRRRRNVPLSSSSDVEATAL